MLAPYEKALFNGDSTLNELELNLREQNYPLEKFIEMRGRINEYIKQTKSVIENLKTEDTVGTVQYLSEITTSFKHNTEYYSLVNHITHFENQLEE